MNSLIALAESTCWIQHRVEVNPSDLLSWRIALTKGWLRPHRHRADGSLRPGAEAWVFRFSGCLTSAKEAARNPPSCVPDHLVVSVLLFPQECYSYFLNICGFKKQRECYCATERKYEIDFPRQLIKRWRDIVSVTKIIQVKVIVVGKSFLLTIQLAFAHISNMKYS